jgi:hypothetical protein
MGLHTACYGDSFTFFTFYEIKEVEYFKYLRTQSMVNRRVGGGTLGKQQREWLGCKNVTVKNELDEDEIK